MADSVEMQDIRGLDIDKMVKGFALTEYKFKSLCTVSKTSGDHIRWYQETAADLTATAPSYVANISPLSSFPTLEVTWTRNTSYVKKYAAEGFISMEDIKSADVDVLARTLLRLTRAVVKQVDTDIWNVLTENQTATNINGVTITAGDEWDSATIANRDPIQDILNAKKAIAEQNYDSDKGGVLCLNPKDYANLLGNANVRNAGQFYTSSPTSDGNLQRICGLDIMVSPNVTPDYAAVIIRGAAGTWKSFTDTTSRVIEEPGIGNKIRVWELGITLLTDPKAVCLISNTAA